MSIWLPEERLFLIDKNNEKIAVNTKLLSSVLLPSMLLGAAQVFAQKLDAPIAAKEDLLTFAGVEYEVSVDDKGETTYTILDSSKEGAQEIYEAAISENNRRIEQVWEENALSKFAEKKKLSIDFENAKYGLVQFNCKLTGITVDELAKKLKYQVVEKTEKTTSMTGCTSTLPTRKATRSCSVTARAASVGAYLKQNNPFYLRFTHIKKGQPFGCPFCKILFNKIQTAIF